ncbi:MAG: hypothetical protein DWI24_10775 [Planctomycetota bacterium]|nr:MAG: hypothetical protein DWI24_10775 [Planctomycetota bacterium]
MKKTQTNENSLHDLNKSGMSQREIAFKLGIGRARVFYLEKQALSKIKSVLHTSGVEKISDIENSIIAGMSQKTYKNPKLEPYSSLHGWLSVDRIISLNKGSIDVTDIVRSYKFLKESHEVLLRPSIIIKDTKCDIKYCVQAVAEFNSQLYIRCWPTEKRVSRSVKHLSDRKINLFTKSIFDKDINGDFDIPLIMCCIVSKKPLQENAN